MRHAVQFFGRTLCQLYNTLGIRQKTLPLLRQLQQLSAAHKKRLAQFGLKLLDSVGYGRLRHKQLICSVSVIFQFRQQKKGSKGISVHKTASYDKNLIC